MTAPLLLVGCGKMGGALLNGWIRNGTAASSVYIVEPNDEIAAALARNFGVHTFPSAHDLPADFQPALVMLAVKPQVMDSAVQDFRPYVRPETVFLSIAAGKPISFFEKTLGPDAHIVRAMPNTPAAVGRGITVCCANGLATDHQCKLCDDLLSAVGKVRWIDDEALMDAVTGVSGSGPAYVFHMVEAMRDAGVKAGLPEDLATDLARATVIGAGELLHHAKESAAQLRTNVTSPGGTTAAALEILMDDTGLTKLMTEAVSAAASRGRELAE